MVSSIIKNDETWLICGGRDFADQAMFDNAMWRLTGMFGMPETIVHGDAKGADAMAAAWAIRMATKCIAVAADWEKYGTAAGPVRNTVMLIRHKPKRLIAFPGGKGTADMIARARNRKGAIEIIEIIPGETSQDRQNERHSQTN